MFQIAPLIVEIKRTLLSQGGPLWAIGRNALKVDNPAWPEAESMICT